MHKRCDSSLRMHISRFHSAVPVVLLLLLLGSSACSSADGVDGDSSHDEERSATLGRLTISDAESAEVHVIDLDEGDITTVGVQAPGAYVSSGTSGRYAFLSHYEDGRFEVVDTGLVITGHDDHFHVTHRAPEKHDFFLDGERPSHVVLGSDHVAVTFDGEGYVALFPYGGLGDDRDLDVAYVDANRPHHGVGVPFGETLLLTYAEESTEQDEEEGWLGGVPVGVTVRDWDDPDVVSGTVSGCGHLHGEAVVGAVAVFACDEGVLRLSVDEEGAVTDEMLDYPAEIDVRTWGFAHGDGDLVVGDSGGGLLRVDVRSGSIAMYELPDGAERVAHAVALDGSAVYALDGDGRLHCLNTADFEPCGEPLNVVDAIGAMDRVLVVAGTEQVHVIDARDGHLHTVHAEEWSLEGDPVQLPGVPFSAAFTGRLGGAH